MKDDELLVRLRAADPAATASAPAPDINRLVEAAMTTDSTSRTSTTAGIPTSADRPVHRRRRFALAAAAVALLLVGGGATWKAVADHGSHGDQVSAGTPLALTLASGGDAKCMEPTVDLLRRFDVAFEGSVTSRKDEQVVFRIDHWFRGGDADTAQLTNGGADGGSETLVFDVGQSYLVTAQDGVVPVCGGTNLASPEGEALFHRAFDK
ncbi:hypothetical protein [Streptomyces sp. NRRL WC-3744]|uniref:hypothetical protein n=1 Tax=Streptomyces sp. NRRL WC-3744 TaxID=1463935 RepID=UPI0004C8CAB0|nr:hypothetical protein [Streptomyces sp. NRRL WC-3744]